MPRLSKHKWLKLRQFELLRLPALTKANLMISGGLMLEVVSVLGYFSAKGVVCHRPCTIPTLHTMTEHVLNQLITNGCLSTQRYYPLMNESNVTAQYNTINPTQ